MPLNKQQREEKDDRRKNSTLYRVAIGAIFFVFMLLAWWAMMKLNSKLMSIRGNFLPFMKWLVLIGCIVVLILIVVIALLNFWGKQSQRDDHQDTDE